MKKRNKFNGLVNTLPKASNARSVLHVTTVTCAQCNNNVITLFKKHPPRNILDLLKIKKSSKIGGLMLVAPKGCYSRCFLFFRNSWAVTLVTCYIHMGVSPTMPREPKALRLLHTQPAQTGTHNTEPPQSIIQASKSPLLHNTHTQRRKRP